MDHNAEAHRWYEQAVEWTDKKMPKNEELKRFRAEAANLLGIPAVAPKPAVQKSEVRNQKSE